MTTSRNVMVRRAAAALALAGMLASCSGGGGAPESRPDDLSPLATSGPQASSAMPPLPAGWRWESYRDVMVGVPGEWGWTNGDQRITQWCVGDGSPKNRGAVGRPGAVSLVGCGGGEPGGPDPGSTLREGGTFVALTAATEFDDRLQTEADRTVLRLGDAAVIVIQAEEGLREQIAATALQVGGSDHNSCAVTHPVSADPTLRPTPVDLAALADSSSVTACRYELPRLGSEPAITGPSLISSLTLRGDEARLAIAALLDAPTGGGPDAPKTCSRDSSYGDEMVVLRIFAGDVENPQMHVRYSGCDHNGIDDGTSLRRLTTAALLPILAQPNLPGGYSAGTVKRPIMRPVYDAARRQEVALRR
ncbi:MAG: hypothetical protein ACT4P1_15340 [Sporichthyaceae bacterium]